MEATVREGESQNPTLGIGAQVHSLWGRGGQVDGETGGQGGRGAVEQFLRDLISSSCLLGARYVFTGSGSLTTKAVARCQQFQNHS